jgi:hypothetical protein
MRHSTHWRSGTGGSTLSTRLAAGSAMRRPPQLGQKPRPLHENGTKRSKPQTAQRRRDLGLVRVHLDDDAPWVGGAGPTTSRSVNTRGCADRTLSASRSIRSARTRSSASDRRPGVRPRPARVENLAFGFELVGEGAGEGRADLGAAFLEAAAQVPQRRGPGDQAAHDLAHAPADPACRRSRASSASLE